MRKTLKFFGEVELDSLQNAGLMLKIISMRFKGPRRPCTAFYVFKVIGYQEEGRGALLGLSGRPTTTLGTLTEGGMMAGESLA